MTLSDGMMYTTDLPKQFGWLEENVLLDWNLVDESGNDIPVGPGCLMKVSKDLGSAIVTAWFTEVTNLPDPLGQNLKDGNEHSPMEAAILEMDSM